MAMAGAGAMLVPRHVLGGQGFVAPSDRLNIAIVGAGGMGMSNAEQVLSENIVALCDVDFGYVDRQAASRLKRGDGTPRPEGNSCSPHSRRRSGIRTSAGCSSGSVTLTPC